jgi:copper chaperone
MAGMMHFPCGSDMMDIKLTVPDMSCGHCVATIEAAVKRLDGQAVVQADLVHHEVRVQTSASEQSVRDALKEEGYPPADTP